MRRMAKVFDEDNVRGILEGRKTQFREILGDGVERLPYAVGDRIVVQEDWAAFWGPRHPGGRIVTEAKVPQGNGSMAEATEDNPLHVFYAADDLAEAPKEWRPASEMQTWASRIVLVVNAVRVGRLQDLTEADAESEGSAFEVWDMALAVRDYSTGGWFHMWSTDSENPAYREEDVIWRASFRTRWEAMHGPGSWDANPLVCIVTFGIDSVIASAAREAA
jgi:hypothetical protein